MFHQYRQLRKGESVYAGSYVEIGELVCAKNVSIDVKVVIYDEEGNWISSFDENVVVLTDGEPAISLLDSAAKEF